MSSEALSLSKICYRRGGTSIVDTLEASFPEGSRSMIIGENGTGKTTLIKICLGLLAPDSGSVEVLGRLVGSKSWAQRRDEIAYLHQGSIDVDFPFSAREVVAIGLAGSADAYHRVGRERIGAAMRMAGCGEIGRRAYSVLSGGEKQKVSIARCLAQEPKMLLLDEPCSSLDPESNEEIMRLLDELAGEKQITILMVTHDLSHLERPGWKVYRMQSGVFV